MASHNVKYHFLVENIDLVFGEHLGALNAIGVGNAAVGEIPIWFSIGQNHFTLSSATCQRVFTWTDSCVEGRIYVSVYHLNHRFELVRNARARRSVLVSRARASSYASQLAFCLESAPPPLSLPPLHQRAGGGGRGTHFLSALQRRLRGMKVLMRRMRRHQAGRT